MFKFSTNDNKLIRNFVMKSDKKDDFFHSSAFGASQNTGNIGTASSGMTMSERNKIEERRKYIQKYNNSKIFDSAYNLQRAKQYSANTITGRPAAPQSNSTQNSQIRGFSGRQKP